MLVAVRVEPRLINLLDFKVSLIMKMALAFCRIYGCKPGLRHAKMGTLK
jgi:hypothetical protein